MRTLLTFLALAAAGPRGGAAVIEVEAGPHDRPETPVVVAAPADLPRARAYALTEPDGRTTPAQAVPGDPPSLAFVVRDLPAGATRRYRVAAADRPPAADDAACVDDGRSLTLLAGGRPVLRYHTATVEPPEGLDPVYRRSGYIHPLWTPKGRAVTDDFAPDHAHQHGLFFAWVNTTFDGHPVDFWNQQGRSGRVRHVEVVGKAGGPVFAQFTVRLRHEDVSRPGEPVPVLDETWTVRAYDLPGRPLVDFASRQVTAGPRPLTVNRYHYGGLGFRGNRAWFDPGARGEAAPDPARSGGSAFLTSEGKARADGNHTRPRWVDLSGSVGDGAAGVTVFGHPENFRAPQPVRLHPNKPYFSVSPPVAGGFTIAPGDPPFVSRYRIVAHDGRPDPADLRRLDRDLADPPRARVLKDD